MKIVILSSVGNSWCWVWSVVLADIHFNEGQVSVSVLLSIWTELFPTSITREQRGNMEKLWHCETIKVFPVNFPYQTWILLKLSRVGDSSDIRQLVGIENWRRTDLTYTADTETRSAVSSLLPTKGGTLRGRVAGSHIPINSSTSIVVKFDNLKDAEHWNKQDKL